MDDDLQLAPQDPAPQDWRTGHPDSPKIRAAVVASILTTWRKAWKL